MKKICIIGGGFYGCYLAKKFKEKYKSKVQIDIFEKNTKLIQEAGKNNQHKLHLGFHYPRSMSTIKQVINGSKKFTKEFKKFVFFPEENLYLIHKKSRVNSNIFFNIFKKLNLKINKFDLKKIKILKNPNDFTSAYKVREGVIKFNQLNDFLIKYVNKNCKIYKNEIIKVNSSKGIVFDSKKKKYNYDFIFNCTYTNPNMGLKEKFKIKYEFVGMVIFKNVLKKRVGITIMDGPFATLYPRHKSFFSISSVKFTPIKRFKNLKDLYKYQKNFKDFSKKNMKLILNHARKYFNNNLIIKNPKLITSPKTKIKNDKNDQRPSLIKNYKKTYSILAGKIDVAPIIFEKLSKKIKI